MQNFTAASIRSVLIVGLLLLCRGSEVAGASRELDAGQTAKIIFYKSYDRGTTWGRGTYQVYFQLPNNTCKDKKRSATFGALSGSEKEVIYPANRRMAFWALTRSLTIGWTASCQNSFAFSPLAGHVYDVRLRTEVESGCVVEVTDRLTNTMPPDLTADHSIQCKF